MIVVCAYIGLCISVIIEVSAMFGDFSRARKVIEHSEKPDYWRIAEMEREIWGCTFFNPRSPVPMSDASRTLTDIGLRLNVDPTAATKVNQDSYQDWEG